MRRLLLIVAAASMIASVGCGGQVDPQSRTKDPQSTSPLKPRTCPGAIPGSQLAAPGPPHKLASGNQVLGLDVGQDDVFYVLYDTTSGDSKLWKVPKNGGSAQLVGSSNEDVRVDQNYAYVNAFRYPVNGGPVEKSASGFSFALDDSYIYTANFTNVSRALKGSLVTTPLELDRNDAQGISTSGDWVYWVDYSGDQVLRAPKVGGDVEVLATGHFPRQVVADCVEAFATIGNYGGPVIAATLAAPHTTRTIANFGSSLAIDDAAVYVFGPTVYRVAVNGAPNLQAIGTGSDYEATGGAVQIAVDETNVYWASSDGVWAAAK